MEVIIIVNLKDFEGDYLYNHKRIKKNAIKLKRSEFIKEGEKLSICSDTMFKTMLYNTNRLKYSAKLISYFIDVSYEELLKNLKLSKGELDKDISLKKGQRCDYVAKIGNTTLNIEVNNCSDPDIMERNIEFLNRLYAEESKSGEKYQYRQIIQININNFAFSGNDKIIDIFHFQNAEGIILTNKQIIIQIYIPNLRKKWYNEGIESLTEVEKYALVLVETDVEASKLIGDDMVMKEYISEAVESSNDQQVLFSYNAEYDIKHSGIEEGREIGIKEGMKEGIKEGKRSLILNMQKKGMSEKEIAQLIDISEDEIKNILKN